LTRPVTQLVAAGARTMMRSPELRRRLRPYQQSGEELLLATLATGIDRPTLSQAARGPLARAVAEHNPMDTLTPHLRRMPVLEHGLVNTMRYLDLKLTLGAGILTKVDRASMAVSLETRPVFLNRQVMDLAGQIPATLLADGGEAKKALRESLREWLPATVLDRPKMGFAMPLGPWLRDDLPGLAGSLRAEGPLSEFLEPGYTRSVADAQRTGGQRETARLHSLLFLDNWLEKWS